LFANEKRNERNDNEIRRSAKLRIHPSECCFSVQIQVNSYSPPNAPISMTGMSFPKVYTVNGPSSTSSSTLPSWLTIKPRASNHRKRVRTQRQLGQLELIQDFAFPESAIRIRTTPDGHYAIGTGSYKPMMKVWDLAQLTVKFERVTDAENVDFVVSTRSPRDLDEG
jgi:hypothetical protein